MAIVDVPVTPSSATEISVTVPAGLSPGAITLQALDAVNGDSNTLPFTLNETHNAESVGEVLTQLSSDMDLIVEAESTGEVLTTLVSAMQLNKATESTGEVLTTLTSEMDLIVQAESTGEVLTELASAMQLNKAARSVGEVLTELESSMILPLEHDAESTALVLTQLASDMTVDINKNAQSTGTVTTQLSSSMAVDKSATSTGEVLTTLSSDAILVQFARSVGEVLTQLDSEMRRNIGAESTGQVLTRLSSLMRRDSENFTAIATRFGPRGLSEPYYEFFPVSGLAFSTGVVKTALVSAMSLNKNAQSTGTVLTQLSSQMRFGDESAESTGEVRTNLSSAMSLNKSAQSTGTVTTQLVSSMSVVIPRNAESVGTVTTNLSSEMAPISRLAESVGEVLTQLSAAMALDRNAQSVGTVLTELFSDLSAGAFIDDDHFAVQKRGNASRPSVVQDVLANDVGGNLQITGVRDFVNCTAMTNGSTVTVTVDVGVSGLGAAGYTYDVTDLEPPGGSGSADVTIDVINTAPVIDSIPGQVARVDDAFSLQVVATDANGDPLTYQIGNEPPGMVIDSNGLISWMVDGEPGDAYSVAVIASDGEAIVQTGFDLVVVTTWVPSTPPPVDQWEDAPSPTTVWEDVA